MARAFRISKPSGSTVYRITVPVEIARLLEGVDLIPTLTDEGLCYRPAHEVDLAPAVPDWVPRAQEAAKSALPARRGRVRTSGDAPAARHRDTT